jgi:hypothetical protein
LKAYAACEFAALCGALLVLASSPALSALVALPGGDVWIIAGVVLLAIPWGASFPFAVAAGLPEGGGDGTRQDGDGALEVHVIYGANALGGAVGALAVGLFLVPGLGEANALAVCAMLEALAGGGAVILARRSLLLSAAPVAAGIDEETTAATTGPRSALGLVAAFLFLSGFAGLYWEVLWTRILVLVAGSTVYAFSIIAVEPSSASPPAAFSSVTGAGRRTAGSFPASPVLHSASFTPPWIVSPTRTWPWRARWARLRFLGASWERVASRSS